MPAEKFVPEMAASSDPVVVYNDGQAGDVGDGEPQHMTQVLTSLCNIITCASTACWVMYHYIYIFSGAFIPYPV